MNDVALSIALTEARSTLNGTEGTLEDRLRTAMRATHDHWMCTNEDAQLRAAVGAVMDFYGKESEEWRRLGYELRQLRRAFAMIGALQAGLSVDMPDEESDAPQRVGIMELWRETAH